MKKIIYLPLIALIVLCSCKGHSFMKQRYTNFAHTSGKNALAKMHATGTEKKVVENTETEIAEYPQTAGVLEKGPVLFVKGNLVEPLKSNFQNTGLSITRQRTNKVENAKPEFKSKEVTQKQRSAAQRIIGTLLKIMLLVIILAVVVGIILIIGALA